MQIFIATTNPGTPSLLSALGIDWKLLVVQTIAFLILVWTLSKFVYPVLIKSIDDRRNVIEAGLREAKESHESLSRAEAKIEKILADARAEADEILARSHQEASAVIADAEKSAKTRAERIVQDARIQLDSDVIKARQTLKKDMAKLVVMATERIISEKLDADKDAALIERAVNKDKA